MRRIWLYAGLDQSKKLNVVALVILIGQFQPRVKFCAVILFIGSGPSFICVLIWGSSRSDILHPTHFVMLMLKKRLLDLYRLYPEPADNPELLRRYLQRQIDLGEEQLAVLDKLQPGALRQSNVQRFFFILRQTLR